MDNIEYLNISGFQSFAYVEYDCEDIGDGQSSDEYPQENLDSRFTYDNNEDDDTSIVEIYIDGQDKEINIIETYIDEDININETYKNKSKTVKMNIVETLNISPNIPEIPSGNKEGLMIKTPVVLAQLVIPINISSYIDLPQKALEIRDVGRKLRLKECSLIQPTNILYIEGVLARSIEYSTLDSSNPEDKNGKVNHFTIDLPFKCCTAVSFYTEPLDPITNTKDLFQYGEKCPSEFHQISQDFFNEIPFCKILSLKIVEFHKGLDIEIPQDEFTKIQENLNLELRMEVLQNQAVVILPASNHLDKN